MITTILFLCIFAFFLGSIPFGLIFARMFSGIDLRKTGSGNIGATNARRAGGWKPGIATLACDMLKGAGPVLLAAFIAKDLSPALKETIMGLTAVAAVYGHLFPVYLKFKASGKGVATAAGCFWVISPATVGLAVILFLITATATRRVSPGSLAATAFLPMGTFWLTGSLIFTGFSLIIALAIIFRHKDNIKRLLAGTEPTLRNK